MPDLTIVFMEQCESLDIHTGCVGGYEQINVNAEWLCSCKGFQFCKKSPKWCKHLTELTKSICGWHQQWGNPQKEKGKCPDCGGSTRVVKVGV